MIKDSFLPERIKIYPSVFSLRTGIRKEAGESGKVISGYANIEYKNFLNEIFKSSSGLEGGLLSGAARFLTVKKICDGLCGGDCGTSFAALINELITELRESGISSGDFAEACRRTGREDSLRLISDAFGKYEKLLSDKPDGQFRGFYDLADKKKEVAAFLENALPESAPELLSNASEVVFCNVYSTTELDFRVVKALSVFMGRKGGRVIFRLPYDSERQDAFRFMEQRIQSFEKLGELYPSLELEFSGGMDFSDRNTKRAFIARNIFRSYTEDVSLFSSGKGDGAINSELDADMTAEVFRAQNPDKELDAVFRRIRGLLENGADPARTAVISANISSLRDRILYLSRAYSVPVIFSKGSPLKESPAASFLMLIFRMLHEGLSFELASSFLLSPFADPVSFVRTNSDILRENGLDELAEDEFSHGLSDNTVFILSKRAYLENLYGKRLVSRIREYSEELEGRIRNLAPEPGADIDAELKESAGILPQARLLLASLTVLNSKLTAFRTEASAGVPDIGKLIDSFSSQIDMKGMIFKSSVSSSAESLVFVSDSIASLKMFRASAVAVAAGFKLAKFQFDFGLFYELLSDVLTKTYLPAGAQNSGVCFLEPEDDVGREFDNVFISGLNEGVFPAFIPENPYFSDDDKKAVAGALRKIDREAMEESARRLAEEANNAAKGKADVRLENIGRLYRRALEEQVTSSPFTTSKMLYWKQAFLFLSCIESASKKIVFSFYSKAASGVSVPPSYYMDQVFSFLNETPDSCDVMPDNRLYTKSDLFGIFSCQPVMDAVKRHYRDIFDDFSIILRNSGFAGHPVNDSVCLEAKKTYSPSDAEKYMQCPFKYFAENVLMLRSEREFGMEAGYELKGRLVHDILRRYFSVKRPCDAFDNDILEKSADESFVETSGKSEICHKALIACLKKDIVSMIREWIKNDIPRCSDFPVALTEQPISVSMALNIGGEEKIVGFRGRADRIDMDPNTGRFEIIDYKTGANKQSKGLSFLDKKPRFQPLVYLEAALKGRIKGLKSGVFRYAYIKDASTSEASSDERDNLAYAIDGIESGRFLPSDIGNLGSACNSCGFGLLCRFKKEDSEKDGE